MPHAHRPTTTTTAARALAAVLLAVPAATAEVLEIRRVTEVHQFDDQRLEDHLVQRTEEEGRIYLGEGRARFDQGDRHSWILLEAERRLLLLRHEQGTYHELAMPVRLEDHLPEDLHRAVAELERRVAPRLEIEHTGEEREIAGRQARRTTLEGTAPEDGARFEYELWLADLGFDTRLYRELVRSFGAFDLRLRGLAEQMARLDGFPVLRKSVAHESGSYEVDTRTLVSVERREVGDAVFAPPRGYRLVPFEIDEWLSLDLGDGGRGSDARPAGESRD